MDGELTFWLAVWRILGTMLVLVMLIGMASCQATRAQVRQAIADGAEPIAVGCAMGTVFDREGCALVAAAEAERTRVK